MSGPAASASAMAARRRGPRPNLFGSPRRPATCRSRQKEGGMISFKALGALLDYPTPELHARAGRCEQRIGEERASCCRARRRARADRATRARTIYGRAGTLDRPVRPPKRLSLHLYEHMLWRKPRPRPGDGRPGADLPNERFRAERGGDAGLPAAVSRIPERHRGGARAALSDRRDRDHRGAAHPPRRAGCILMPRCSARWYRSHREKPTWTKWKPSLQKSRRTLPTSRRSTRSGQKSRSISRRDRR